MSDDPHDHDREDQGEPAEPEQPEPEPEPAHDRPGIPEQRAALAAAYAMLLGADADAHEAAAADGACPACTTLAGISLGFAVATSDAGETGLMSQAMRLRLLAWVKVTQAELDTGLN